MASKKKFWDSSKLDTSKMDMKSINPPDTTIEQRVLRGVVKGHKEVEAMGNIARGMSVPGFLRSTTVDTVHPLSISGCVTWIAARNHPEYFDGDLVSLGRDASGSGHNHVQATDANKPIFKSRQIGGMPAFYFDGVDDILSHVYGSAIVRPATFIIVVRYDGTDDNGTHCVWDFSSGAEVNVAQYNLTSADTIVDNAATTGANTINLAVGSLYTDPLIIITEIDASNITLRINAQVNGPTASTGNCGSNSNLGARVAGQRHWKGPMSEWIAYNKILDPTTERIPLVNSLKQVYGLSF